jgi:hypothetical protein
LMVRRASLASTSRGPLGSGLRDAFLFLAILGGIRGARRWDEVGGRPLWQEVRFLCAVANSGCLCLCRSGVGFVWRCWRARCCDPWQNSFFFSVDGPR